MACRDCEKSNPVHFRGRGRGRGRGLRRILHGAAGLASATLGLRRADDATIQRRRAVCGACSHMTPCVHHPRLPCGCDVCGCHLRAKTAITDERCPLAKW